MKCIPQRRWSGREVRLAEEQILEVYRIGRVAGLQTGPSAKAKDLLMCLKNWNKQVCVHRSQKVSPMKSGYDRSGGYYEKTSEPQINKFRALRTKMGQIPSWYGNCEQGTYSDTGLGQ